MEGITTYLEREGDNVPTDVNTLISTQWSSVSQSMLSLFEGGTGGEDWKKYADPLQVVSYFHHKLFLLYITFFLFVVTNILTSLFVDNALNAARTDEVSQLMESSRRKEEHINAVRGIFESMEKDEYGNVSVEEFESHMRDEKMVAFAVSLEVETD